MNALKKIMQTGYLKTNWLLENKLATWKQTGYLKTNWLLENKLATWKQILSTELKSTKVLTRHNEPIKTYPKEVDPYK